MCSSRLSDGCILLKSLKIRVNFRKICRLFGSFLLSYYSYFRIPMNCKMNLYFVLFLDRSCEQREQTTDHPFHF
jgi:hypothetical protein